MPWPEAGSVSACVTWQGGAANRRSQLPYRCLRVVPVDADGVWLSPAELISGGRRATTLPGWCCPFPTVFLTVFPTVFPTVFLTVFPALLA